MTSTPLSYAKVSAVFACLSLGVLHYTLIMLLLAANLTQDISFVPLLFALLAVAHAGIGFVSGYVATKYQRGFLTILVATLVGFIVGLFGALSIIAILASAFPGTQRPIVQHMLAYVMTLSGLGACTSFVCITSYSVLRQAFTHK
jgi:uncharacterized protein YqgC (DUF456 family)